jgi:hypothetical protein
MSTRMKTRSPCGSISRSNFGEKRMKMRDNPIRLQTQAARPAS